jgi:type IV pilus assembly protein PilM
MSNLAQRLAANFDRTARRKSRVGPIGVHFAEEQAHAVQLRRLESGAYCLRAWASAGYQDTREAALTNPVQLRKLLDELIGKRRFSGRKVVTAMPSEEVRVTSLNYQVSGGISDGAAIMRLMAQRLDGSISDYVVDFLPVRGAGNDQDRVALVVTSLRADVLSLLDNISQCGLKVTDIDVSPAALNRLVGVLSNVSKSLRNVLIVNFGAEQTYLTLISGRRLLMDKVVDFGGNLLLDRIARGLDISLAMAEDIALREGLNQQVEKRYGAGGPATAEDLNPVVEIVRPLFSKLAEELRRASLYAAAESQGEPIECIYTFGTIARWPGADEILSQLTRIPVTTSLPVAAIFDTDSETGSGDFSGIGPDLAVATGLALRGLADDS